MKKKLKYTDKPWLNYYEDGVPAHIEFKNIFLPDYLKRSASLFPNNKALTFMGYTLTYQEFDEMVNRFASYLTKCGIKKGDYVALLLPNVIPCVVSFYAVLRIGGIVVMNNPLYSDKELQHQFEDSEAKLLITLDLLANRMIDLRPKTKIKQIIYTSIGDYLPFPKNLLFPLVAKKKNPPMAADVKAAMDVYQWKDIIRNNAPNLPQIELKEDDIAMCQYTGGTTGVSKGSLLTHGNMSKQIQQIGSWFPKNKMGEESMLCALPLFHIMGVQAAMNLAFINAWHLILIPKPQPENLLQTIQQYKPTFAPLVPTMFIGMLNHKDIHKTDMSCFKVLVSGSAPLAVEILNEFEQKTGVKIIEAYGMTEASPCIAMNPAVKTKVGSIGVPLPDTEIRLVDINDEKTDVPIGKSGEIIVKGPQVMKGYRNMKDETKYVLRKGWLYTGDIGIMDEDGYFYIVDRKKDMIISGGYNVYPREVDEVLFEHPKISEACAIGIPHPTRGEQIKAFIVLKEGESATSEEIIEFCKTKLAKYKLPTEVEFRKELPKSIIGKVLRKELRADELKKKK